MRIVYLCWVLSFLIGCSSTKEYSDQLHPDMKNEDPSGLYLRGDMTNWDALPQYKAKAISNNMFTVDVDLLSRQYHFKFASKDWNPDYNFGALTEQRELKIDSPVEIKAGSCMDELLFTPDEAGKYEILLDLSNSTKRVSVHKI